MRLAPPGARDPSAMMSELNTRLKQHPPEVGHIASDLILWQLYGKRKPTWKYSTYAELVLNLATLRTSAIYVPDEEPEFQKMEIGQCFRNAYVGAVELGYQYVEGYALTSFITTAHAWLEDAEGRIIDPTWAHLDLPIDQQVSYAGIKFDTNFLVKRVDETGWYSLLARDWEEKNQALEYGFITNDAGIVIDGGWYGK